MSLAQLPLPTSFCPAWRPPWLPSAPSPGTWHGPWWPSTASPAWAAHSAGLRCHAPAVCHNTADTSYFQSMLWSDTRTSNMPQHSRCVLLSVYILWSDTCTSCLPQHRRCVLLSKHTMIWYTLSLSLSDKHTLSLPFSVKLLHHKL